MVKIVRHLAVATQKAEPPGLGLTCRGFEGGDPHHGLGIQPHPPLAISAAGPTRMGVQGNLIRAGMTP